VEDPRELAALVMSNKGTEISISKDGFGFKTDGEASERLANAVLDFLSPISEGAGFIGTKLRGYRMEAALKATVRAKEICEANNLPINPVPPKFLLQWIEGASLEDINDDDNLIDAWSNLLVSNSSSLNKNSILFCDLLKKIDSSHAKYLFELTRNMPSKVWEDVPITTDVVSLKKFIREDEDIQRLLSSKDLKEIRSQVEMVLSAYLDEAGTELLISSLRFVDRRSKDEVLFIDTKYYNGEVPEDLIAPLHALNLLVDADIDEFLVTPSVLLYVRYLHLSSFGCEFLKSCMPSSQELKTVK